MGLGARERNSDEVRTAHVRGCLVRMSAMLVSPFASFRPLQRGREAVLSSSSSSASSSSTGAGTLRPGVHNPHETGHDFLTRAANIEVLHAPIGTPLPYLFVINSYVRITRCGMTARTGAD